MERMSALERIREQYAREKVHEQIPHEKPFDMSNPFNRSFEEFQKMIRSYEGRLDRFYRENPRSDIPTELVPKTPEEGEIFSKRYEREVRRNSYEWYMKSDKWRLFRNEIFKERGFACELCCSKKNLHLHHITYENFGNEEKEDVIILCKSCHDKAHEKK